LIERLKSETVITINAEVLDESAQETRDAEKQ